MFTVQYLYAQKGYTGKCTRMMLFRYKIFYFVISCKYILESTQ